MATFQKILVAIDDHEHSQAPLNAAIQLARGLGATLRLAHVAEVPVPKASSAQELGEMEKALRADSDALLQTLAQVAAEQGVEADTAYLKIDTMKDSIAERLAEEATAWGADLLVSGTHGRKGILRWMAGSVSESLLRLSPVPVLVVRGSGPPPAGPPAEGGH